MMAGALNAISTSSPEIKALAAKGLQSKGTDQQRYAAQDQFLQSVAAHGSATPMEKAVASTLRQCTAKSLKYPSALHAQRTALQVLAAGVSGPCGQMLARVGLDVGKGAYNDADRYVLDGPFLKAVERHGQPLEQALAEAASSATSVSLKYVTAVRTQQHALQMVSAGVSGSAEALIADFAKKAMGSAYNQEDQHKLARQLLPEIQRAGGSPQTAAIASLAHELTGNSMKYVTAVAAEVHAFQMIASPPSADLDVLRAAYGVKSMGSAYNDEDKYLVANVVLASLEKHAASPHVQAVAHAAAAGAGVGAIKYRSAVGLQSAALNKIQGGLPSEPPEKSIASLGQSLAKIAYNRDDQFKIGAALVSQIKRASTDAKVQALAQWCERMCAGGAGNIVACIQSQQAVFDGVVSGKMVIPAMPVRGVADADIVLPAFDPTADPAQQTASLEDCVAHNKESVRKIEAAIAASAREVSDAHARLAQIKSKVDGLAATETALLQKHAKLGKIANLGGLVALGGFLGTMASGSPIAMAIGAVGGAAMIAGHVLRMKSEQKIAELRGGAQSVAMETLRLQTVIASSGARTGALAKAQEQAEKAIDEAQGHLDVLRMAAAPTVEPDGTVQVEEDFVVVAGVKIPRNTESKPAEQT